MSNRRMALDDSWGSCELSFLPGTRFPFLDDTRLVLVILFVLGMNFKYLTEFFELELRNGQNGEGKGRSGGVG